MLLQIDVAACMMHLRLGNKGNVANETSNNPFGFCYIMNVYFLYKCVAFYFQFIEEIQIFS